MISLLRLVILYGRDGLIGFLMRTYLIRMEMFHLLNLFKEMQAHVI